MVGRFFNTYDKMSVISHSFYGAFLFLLISEMLIPAKTMLIPKAVGIIIDSAVLYFFTSASVSSFSYSSS